MITIIKRTFTLKSWIMLALFALPLSIFSQTSLSSFLDNTDAFLKEVVQDDLVNYRVAKTSETLDDLITDLEKLDTKTLSENDKKAFYINAYNLLVIKTVADNYPTASVMDIPGFFTSKKHSVAGNKVTLDKIEKGILLNMDQDARLHFVLVCGALDCPPIIDKAYRPSSLDQQLNRQVQLAMDDSSFIKVSGTSVELSEIFKWYQSDFGGNMKSVLAFINENRTKALPEDAKVSYYTYDWGLNHTNKEAANTTPEMLNKEQTMEDIETASVNGNNSTRYVVSSVIPKGTTETKLFNNLYTQQTGSTPGELTDRATFFTSSLSAIYGVSRKLNVGFDARYRRVRYNSADDSALDVFSAEDGSIVSRQGLTTIGPKVRWAPVEKWENFSVQSAVWFNTGNDLQDPFIDWDSPTFLTQIFNDTDLGTNFSLFTELDFFLEDIGGETDENRFSTPATVIFSYFPDQKTTLYMLGGYSPFWQEEYDYFTQYGVGAKYQISSHVELELLATSFDNKFLNQTDGKAGTYNIGIRFSK